MKLTLILVAAIFCRTVSFRMLNGNIINVSSKFLSATKQRKTIAAAATERAAYPGVAVASGDVSSSNQDGSHSPSPKVFSSNSVYKEKSVKSSSFVETLVTAKSGTVSEAERSTILSTTYRLVDDVNVVEFARTVCR
jgi:hypothetical protein